MLVVTAAPRFLGVQRDAHEALAQGAFQRSETALICTTHNGLSMVNQISIMVNYGEGDVYPSETGFPIWFLIRHSTEVPQVSGDQCVALWNSLIDSDLAVLDLFKNDTGFILLSDEATLVGMMRTPERYCYYTPSFTASERLLHFVLFRLPEKQEAISVKWQHRSLVTI
ncbi:methylation site containing protein [Vibrio lentus]|nr:methylation site containing protein [Vibrio lentus]